MSVFALRTAPGLLALSGLGAAATRRGTATVTAAVGVLLIGFAALNLYGAVNVAGIAAPAITRTCQPVMHCQPTSPTAEPAKRSP